MDKVVCPECCRPTEIVVDHAAGDTVCTECGLVLESHAIDETPEWRTFSDESSSNDPVRVGAPSNPLLTDSGMSIIITQPNGARGDYMSSLSRWRNRGSDSDRALIVAFGTIADMADGLGLVSTIKDRANEIYKKVEDLKASRGRSKDAILASCLYIACRQEGKSRSLKELCSAAKGTPEADIRRAMKAIIKKLGETGMPMEMGSTHALDFVKRFCSHLGMANNAMRAAMEVVKRSEQHDIRRSPTSIAATAIYMIAQLLEEKRQLKDISSMTRVSKVTIKKSYKDLHPYATKLIPEWFATGEDLKQLSLP